jgi:hypothetical protein
LDENWVGYEKRDLLELPNFFKLYTPLHSQTLTVMKTNHLVLVRATRLGTIEPCLAQALCQKKLESAQAGRPYVFIHRGVDLKIGTLVRATRLGRIEPYLARALCQKKLESAQAGRPFKCRFFIATAYPHPLTPSPEPGEGERTENLGDWGGFTAPIT